MYVDQNEEIMRKNPRFSLSFLLVIFYTFVFIYDPKIVSFNLQHVCGVIGWLTLAINHRCININSNRIFGAFSFCFLMALYLSFVAIINDNPWNGTSIQFIYFIIDIIPGAIFIGVKANEENDNYEYLKRLLFAVAYLQAIIALLSFLIPSVHSFFVDRLYAYGYTRSLDLSVYRLFGASSNLTYTTPIFQSIMAVIGIYDCLYMNRRGIVGVLILVLSAIINARISILVIISGVLIVLISGERKNTFYRKLAFYTLVVSLIAYIMLEFYIDKNSETFIWIQSGIDSIFDLFSGNVTSSYGGTRYYTSFFAVLFSKDYWQLPKGLCLLFGTGLRIMFKNKYGVLSDFGFDSDIWTGGLIYSIVSYSVLFVVINRINLFYKNEHALGYRYGLFLNRFFLIVFIIANIKGYVISTNEYTRLLILMYISLCCIQPRS